MHKRQYTLQYKTIVSGWENILSAQQLTSRQHVIGFAKGMQQFSTCPELRMIDHQTGEVLEHWHRKPGINHPSRHHLELGIEGEHPYFKIDNQTFFIGSEPEVPLWYIQMMAKAFEKLGVKAVIKEEEE